METIEKNGAECVRECEKCHRVLPVGEYDNYGKGRRHVCRECVAKMKAEDEAKSKRERRAEKDARELMVTLRRLGYTGRLRKDVTVTKDVTDPGDRSTLAELLGIDGDVVSMRVSCVVTRTADLDRM